MKAARFSSAFATIIITITLGGPGALVAQEPTRTESLEAEVRRLRARLDSLERVLERLVHEGRDTTAAVDELARLREAAKAAAGATEKPEPGPQQSRTRDLSVLNPEISVTGDLVGSYLAPSGEGNTASATPREFEFSFQAALDPYTRTKIFLTREEDFEIAGFPEDTASAEEESAFEIEEAYLYWVGLPGNIGIKLGKFRQEIGLYNRWHTHALFEVDRPLPTTAFLGEDGLIQTGASVVLPSLTVGPSTQTVTVEATIGNNDVLFDGGNQFSYLGRFQSFWETGAGTFVQFGATGVWGQNDNEALVSRLLGLDFTFRWRPPSKALYRDLQLKGEWYFGERDVAGTTVTANGGYGQLNFRFGRQLIAGTRVDYVGGYPGNPSIVQIVPSLSWWQSEWVRLRLQYHYVRPEGGPGSHTMLFQVVWAVGPHKHETY